MEQTCSICKLDLPLNQFYKGTNKNGRRYACKHCCKIVYSSSKTNGNKRAAKRLKTDAVYKATIRKKQYENKLKAKQDNLQLHIWKQIKSRVAGRGLEFNIEVHDIYIPPICPILGIPLIVSKGRPTDNSPSVDRLDNSKGYIKGNILVVSYRANRLKSNSNLSELQLLVDNYKKYIT